MNKGLGVALLLIGLIVGLAGGAYAGYKYYPTKNKTASSSTESATTATSTTNASSEELVSCLKAKWGEDKYTAVTANPSLASVDDKFNALPCYK